jgi:hypothetical protein
MAVGEDGAIVFCLGCSRLLSWVLSGPRRLWRLRARRAAKGWPKALRLRLCSAARSREPSCQSSREGSRLLLKWRAAGLSPGFGRRLRRRR